MKSELTQSRLKELLDYDPDTGIFTWKFNVSSRARAGTVTGCDDGGGYRQIRVDRRLYRAHRLAWLYMYGSWPRNQVDHINGNRADNRISNLRAATPAENLRNRPKQENNKSGFKGVRWREEKKKWCAEIRINGKAKFLGYFATSKDAHNAYCRAANENFGQFARIA